MAFLRKIAESDTQLYKPFASLRSPGKHPSLSSPFSFHALKVLLVSSHVFPELSADCARILEFQANEGGSTLLNGRNLTFFFFSPVEEGST